MHLLYSMIMVSFPVECWHQPRVPDSGAATFDCVVGARPVSDNSSSAPTGGSTSTPARSDHPRSS